MTAGVPRADGVPVTGLWYPVRNRTATLTAEADSLPRGAGTRGRSGVAPSADGRVRRAAKVPPMTAIDRTTRHPEPDERIGRRVFANLSTAELYERADPRTRGGRGGRGAARRQHRQAHGTQPRDKFVVRDATTEDRVWWGDVNQPIDEAHYDGLRLRLLEYLRSHDLYAQDVHIGAHPAHRRSLRVYTETAWASIFSRNLFRLPSTEQLREFLPNFTIICAPIVPGRSRRATAPAARRRSWSTSARKEILIVGTEYAGEIKKSRVHRDELPAARRGRAPDALLRERRRRAAMRRCSSACRGPARPPSRADPERTLIGDDEHGWGPDGVFNFEGGCYAKTIRLSPMDEPDIFATTRRFGTILENVRHRPGDARARPRHRSDHREHAGRLPAGLHRQCVADRHRRAPAQRLLPHRRRVRRPAAHRPPQPDQAMYYFLSRLHGEAGGHRRSG